MCPRCKQNAPLVYRGIHAFCTGCGAPRVPLTGSSVTHAGQPAKVGGTVARVFGWTVLAAGWLVALSLAGLIGVLGGGWAALVVGGPIALIATLAAWGLLRGGKQLQQSGDDAELATKHQAIYALANARNGVLKAMDVAQALQVSAKEGDDMLTRLAKENPDTMSVDIDDDGNVLYRFPSVHHGGLARMAPNAVPSHVRVGNAPLPVRVDAREPELLDELEDAAPGQRRTR